MASHLVRALTIEGRRYVTSGTLNLETSPRAWDATVDVAGIPTPKPGSAEVLPVVVEAGRDLAVSGPASIEVLGPPLTLLLLSSGDFVVE